MDIVTVLDLEALVHHLFSQAISEKTNLDAIFPFDRMKGVAACEVAERGVRFRDFSRDHLVWSPSDEDYNYSNCASG